MDKFLALLFFAVLCIILVCVVVYSLGNNDDENITPDKFDSYTESLEEMISCNNGNDNGTIEYLKMLKSPDEIDETKFNFDNLTELDANILLPFNAYVPELNSHITNLPAFKVLRNEIPQLNETTKWNWFYLNESKPVETISLRIASSIMYPNLKIPKNPFVNIVPKDLNSTTPSLVQINCFQVSDFDYKFSMQDLSNTLPNVGLTFMIPFVDDSPVIPVCEISITNFNYDDSTNSVWFTQLVNAKANVDGNDLEYKQVLNCVIVENNIYITVAWNTNKMYNTIILGSTTEQDIISYKVYFPSDGSKQFYLDYKSEENPELTTNNEYIDERTQVWVKSPYELENSKVYNASFAYGLNNVPSAWYSEIDAKNGSSTITVGTVKYVFVFKPLTRENKLFK